MNSDALAWAVMFITLLIVMYGTWVIAYNHGLMDGMDMNLTYYKKLFTWMTTAIEIRNDIIAKYRDISSTMCDDMNDCNYCPYIGDTQKEPCKLWKLNKEVDKFKIPELHVKTRYEE